MSDSKLITLLKALSPEELKQFEKFIDSPFYNKGRDLLPFFRVLKNFYPGFANDKMINEFIFKKLFPGKKTEATQPDNYIRPLASHLFKVCKEFLIHLELESQKKKKKYLLLNQLRKKKLYKEFDREFDAVDDNSDDPEKGSIGYFVDKHLIKAVKRDCCLDRDDFHNSFENMIQASEDISVAALISVFKFEDEKNLSLGYILKPRDNLMGSIIENFDPVGFLSDAEKSNPAYYPYLQIFQGFYMMNRFKENREHYHKLKELLIKYSVYFGQQENYVMWNMMNTYCNVNKMPPQEFFELYRYMLENGIYKKSDDEDFHVILFRNIVLLSSGRGEYDWLENFIERYSPELHEFHRENMKVFSMAYLCFTRSEFEKALEYIMKVKYDLFIFQIDMKILQSRIYYELGYFEEGLSLAAATLNYLNTSKNIDDVKKEDVGNFIKCLRNLIKIRSYSQYTDNDLCTLQTSAEKILIPNLKKWILKKINLLKPKQG